MRNDLLKYGTVAGIITVIALLAGCAQTRVLNKLEELISKEPNWDLLLDEKVVKKLFHIHDHIDILRKLQPRSVEQLAAVLAIIRPAKRQLLEETWQQIEQKVWQKPVDGTYYFKKSHAISYAILIVMQLNSIVF